ncbi:unnamed protein product [Durusdinium trenchii]|uniref:Uncharacterized protein n=1 Tax=Durusdinium trenchii TaxID=1381693 RepID=A0ABP0J479_9DINO
MAKRKADQTEDQFETPQKLSRRAEPLAECLSLLDVQQAVPDFGGLLADYLWCDEDETAEVGSAKGTRPVQEMLMTGRSAQLQLITGMKEARLIDRRSAQSLPDKLWSAWLPLGCAWLSCGRRSTQSLPDKLRWPSLGQFDRQKQGSQSLRDKLRRAWPPLGRAWLTRGRRSTQSLRDKLRRWAARGFRVAGWTSEKWTAIGRRRRRPEIKVVTLVLLIKPRQQMMQPQVNQQQLLQQQQGQAQEFLPLNAFDVHVVALFPSAFIWRTLLGDYVEKGVNHGRKYFQKVPAKNAGPDYVEVFLYYWDNRDGASFEGWWFGNKLGGTQVWSHVADKGLIPPSVGWKIPWDGQVRSTLQLGPKEEMHRQEAEEKLKTISADVAKVDAEAKQALQQATTLAGNMANTQTLLQAEQILTPHSSAMIEVQKKLAEGQRGTSGEMGRSFVQLANQLRTRHRKARSWGEKKRCDTGKPGRMHIKNR